MGNAASAQSPVEPKARSLVARLWDLVPTTAAPSRVLVYKLGSESTVYLRRMPLKLGHPVTRYSGLAAVWGLENLHAYNTKDANDIILVGRSSAGKGAIALLRDGTQGFSQVGAVYEEAGSRFVSAAYSGKKARLYVLDSWKQRIVYADVAVGAASVPTQWTTLLTSQALPALGAANEYLLYVIQDGDEPVVVFSAGGNLEASSYAIKDGAQGVSVTLHRMGTGDSARVLTHPLLVNGLTVQIQAAPAGHVELVDLVGMVLLGEGVVPPNGLLDLQVPPVTWGQIYSARMVGGPLGPPFLFPYQSWGQPESLDPNLTLRAIGRVEAATAWVGHEKFQATLGIEWQQAPKTPVSHNATLLVGTEQDLIPLGGGRYALLGESVVAFPTTIDIDPAVLPIGFGVVPLPIPNDANLGGTVTLYQWIVSPSPSEAILSNVAGIYIYPDRFDPDQVPQGLMATKSGRGLATKSKRRPESVVVSASRYKWLVTKNKGVLLDKKTRTTLRKLVQKK